MKTGKIVTLAAAGLLTFAFGPTSFGPLSNGSGVAYAAPGGAAGGGGRGGASTGGGRGTTGTRATTGRITGPTGRINPIRSAINARASARAAQMQAGGTHGFRSGSGRTYRVTRDWEPHPGYPTGYYPFNYNYWLYVHSSGGSGDGHTVVGAAAPQGEADQQGDGVDPTRGYSQVYLGCTPNAGGETWSAYITRCTALEANARYVAHVVPGCRPVRNESVGSFSHRCVFGGAATPTGPAAE